MCAAIRIVRLLYVGVHYRWVVHSISR